MKTTMIIGFICVTPLVISLIIFVIRYLIIGFKEDPIAMLFITIELLFIVGLIMITCSL